MKIKAMILAILTFRGVLGQPPLQIASLGRRSFPSLPALQNTPDMISPVVSGVSTASQNHSNVSTNTNTPGAQGPAYFGVPPSASSDAGVEDATPSQLAAAAARSISPRADSAAQAPLLMTNHALSSALAPTSTPPVAVSSALAPTYTPPIAAPGLAVSGASAPSHSELPALAGVEDATPGQLAAAAARMSPVAIPPAYVQMAPEPAPVVRTSPAGSLSIGIAPAGVKTTPESAPSLNMSQSPHSQNVSVISMTSPRSNDILGNVSCNVGIALGNTWHNGSIAGESYVVYLYVTGGNQTIEIPWSLTVDNPNYSTYIEWWNIDKVKIESTKMTGYAVDDWETLQEDAINTVDIGFIIQSSAQPSDAVERFPTVSVNHLACNVYAMIN